MQANYHCSLKACGKTVAALKVMENASVPDFVKASYPIILTEKSAISSELVSIIVHDATSAKSFEELGVGIANSRATECLRKRLIYCQAIEHFCDKSGGTLTGVVNASTLPIFSTLDNREGYNEMLQPTSEYLTEFYCGKWVLKLQKICFVLMYTPWN